MEAETLASFVRKLGRYVPLAPEQRDALLAMPRIERSFRPGTVLLREDAPMYHCVVIVSGYACRHKTVATGGRQILSFHLAGDGVGFTTIPGRNADPCLQAITEGTAALIPVTKVQELTDQHPSVLRALWYDMALEAAVQREWTINLGRRDARTRIAHFLCEFALLQARAELGELECFDLPMTQEQLGDATGLTPVHVNRTLQSLTADKLIVRNKRCVTIPNWKRLASAGDFSSKYLTSFDEPTGDRIDDEPVR